jgi:hypothetical protein
MLDSGLLVDPSERYQGTTTNMDVRALEADYVSPVIIVMFWLEFLSFLCFGRTIGCYTESDLNDEVNIVFCLPSLLLLFIFVCESDLFNLLNITVLSTK